MHEWALRTKSHLLKKNLNNCKVITNKLSLFNLDKIFTELEAAIFSTMNYIKNLYKGYYCTVCNVDNHPLINI